MLQLIKFKSRLGRRVQKIEYESVPFACFHYKKVGHKDGIYPLFKGKGKEGKAQNKDGKKNANDPKKEWKKKDTQDKKEGETEGKVNNKKVLDPQA